MSMAVPPGDGFRASSPNPSPISRIQYTGNSRSEKQAALARAALKDLSSDPTLKHKPRLLKEFESVTKHLFEQYITEVHKAIDLLRRNEDYSLDFFTRRIAFGERNSFDPETGVERHLNLALEPVEENKFQIIKTITNPKTDRSMRYIANMEIDPLQESAVIKQLIATSDDNQTNLEFTEGSGFSVNGTPDTLLFLDLSPIKEGTSL